MRCSGCGTPNDAGRRFCLECGVRLATGCPNCGSENPPGAKFCGECGAAIGAGAGPAAADASRGRDREAAEGRVAERRLVSVLFADIVGFTPFSEARDAEEVRELLTRYFDVSREVIERYGGSVEKFIGDAVMAVWGTPVSHEDDAERAVRAALELIDAVAGMGEGLRARAGVLAGDAAVTVGATAQGMVAGDLVNTAARVQSLAEPGTVLVGETTMRSASGAVVFEAAGEHELKGKSTPLPLWRALRVVAERGGRGRSDGLEAPFVGRDVEFRLLKELFHAAGRERQARLVSVSGQAGIGKSRLAWEFEKYLDGLVETVWWHHGRSPAYGSGVTFWALGEMIRGRCGLAEQDDDATTRARVREAIERFVPDGPDRDWIESALLTLLGVDEAQAQSEQLFPAWRSFFEHIARQGTTMLVFEDLQWADPGLLAFIDHLMSWSHDLPICVVTLARPELVEARPDWGAGQRGFTSISLSPLGLEAMTALLTGLVPGLPQRSAERIIERAAGIPLYAVETVRMLVADGRLVLDGESYRPVGDLSELEVPETLRSLVSSRLDSLEASDRQMLQSAAVLGHTFAAEALAAVTSTPESELEPRLRQLLRREMLVRRADPRSPERGQYAFAQELLREVGYETLAREDRRSLHLAAARYFESLDADELAGALAVQYQAAYRNSRPGPEADTLAIQARRSLKAAADRALALGSTEQAQGLYEAALELTTESSEQALMLELTGKAAVLAGDSEAATRSLERAVAIYRDLGQRSQAARATASLVDATLHSGWNIEAAAAIASQAATDYEDLGEDRGLVEVLAQVARLEMLRQDDLSLAVATADRALGMAERLDLLPIVADLLVTRGTALASVGRPLEGLGAIEAGRRLAAAEGLTRVEHRALLNMSGPLSDRDPRAFLEASRLSLDLARRDGSRPAASLAANNVAEAARITGDWDLALAELRREAEASSGDNLLRIQAILAIIEAERGVDVTELVTHVVEYGEAHVLQGERSWRSELDGFVAGIDMPAGRYREAAAGFQRAGDSDAFNATNLFGSAGIASLLAGDAVAASAALERLEAISSFGAMVKLDRRRIQAGIDALEGREEEARAGFRGCLDEYRRMELPYMSAMTGLVMASVLDPGMPDVVAAMGEAREAFEQLQARAWIDRLDDALTSQMSPTSDSGRSASKTAPTSLTSA